MKEVMAVTGLSRSSIYNYINDIYFPGQVSLGCRSIASSFFPCR
ncbi:AlpA family phage regulatory protein [Grimontia sp. SpTr1]|nr:AlpA family phage regulatory protein [Grimontia sp. SpTr1]